MVSTLKENLRKVLSVVCFHACGSDTSARSVNGMTIDRIGRKIKRSSDALQRIKKNN